MLRPFSTKVLPLKIRWQKVITEYSQGGTGKIILFMVWNSGRLKPYFFFPTLAEPQAPIERKPYYRNPMLLRPISPGQYPATEKRAFHNPVYR